MALKPVSPGLGLNLGALLTLCRVGINDRMNGKTWLRRCERIHTEESALGGKERSGPGGRRVDDATQ